MIHRVNTAELSISYESSSKENGMLALAPKCSAALVVPVTIIPMTRGGLSAFIKALTMLASDLNDSKGGGGGSGPGPGDLGGPTHEIALKADAATAGVPEPWKA